MRRPPGSLEGCDRAHAVRPLQRDVKGADGRGAHLLGWRSRALGGAAADALVVEVRDDGIGGRDHRPGVRAPGLADRVEAVHGVFRVDSPAEEGTVISAVILVDAAPRPGPAADD